MILVYLFIYFSLQNVEAGDLNLSPSGTVMSYVNRDITFVCYHSNSEIQSFEWIINANSTVKRMLKNQREITSTNEVSRYEIRNALAAFNGTEIQCKGITTNGDVLYSNATILLQDVPSAVEDVSISINDYSVFITWSIPYVFFGSSQLQYLVNITNLTGMNTTTRVVHNANFTLMSPHRRIACDDFMFTIIPENGAGRGENRTITHINEEIYVIDRNLTLNLKNNNVDLLLSTTAPLCEMMDMSIFNKNLNDTKTKEENFLQFSLIDTMQDKYVYLIIMELQRRFEYEVTMNLNNKNSNASLNLSISTHSIQNVSVDTLSSDMLEIEIFNSPNYVDGTGALLAFLYCNSDYCDTFNYSNSLYLSIHKSGTHLYNIKYAAGKYLIYAYDTGIDGALLSSITNISFPVFIQEVILNYSGASKYYRTVKGADCTLFNQNNTVGTSCANEYIQERRKQVILQHDNQAMLTFSEPSSINYIDCVGLQMENDIVYAFIIAVSSENERTEPIGRDIISDHYHYSTSPNCGSSPHLVSPTPPNKDGTGNIGIIIGTILGTVLMILFAVMISFTGILIFLRRSVRRLSYTFH